ncbi:MAG: molybdenum cofactor biosynthesis protein B [Promethearchaeota archaeon]
MGEFSKLPDTVTKHRDKAPTKVRFALIIVSTSRAQDSSVPDRTMEHLGPLIKEVGHQIVHQQIIVDDIEIIQRTIQELILKDQIDSIIFSGGTGIASYDVTVEAVQPLFDKELTAFSSVFAILSHDQVGSAAILSRATAGIIKKKPVFLLPGSPKAVLMGCQKIILPEIGHILNLCRKKS